MFPTTSTDTEGCIPTPPLPVSNLETPAMQKVVAQKGLNT